MLQSQNIATWNACWPISSSEIFQPLWLVVMLCSPAISQHPWQLSLCSHILEGPFFQVSTPNICVHPQNFLKLVDVVFGWFVLATVCAWSQPEHQEDRKMQKRFVWKGSSAFDPSLLFPKTFIGSDCLEIRNYRSIVICSLSSENGIYGSFL